MFWKIFKAFNIYHIIKVEKSKKKMSWIERMMKVKGSPLRFPHQNGSKQMSWKNLILGWVNGTCKFWHCRIYGTMSHF